MTTKPNFEFKLEISVFTCVGNWLTPEMFLQLNKMNLIIYKQFFFKVKMYDYFENILLKMVIITGKLITHLSMTISIDYLPQ